MGCTYLRHKEDWFLGNSSRDFTHMLSFVLILILTIYYVLPVLASAWSVYGLIKWRGIWRMLALPPLIVAFIGLAYCAGREYFGSQWSVALSDGLFKLDLALIPYVLCVTVFRRDAQKKRSERGENTGEIAGSTKKIFISIALVTALGAVIWMSYYYFSYKRGIERGGFEVAGIQPIAGAKMLSVNFPNSSMMGGTTIWVYRLPAGYAPALYKDCSRIGFKQGTYRDHNDGDYDVNHYIMVKPGDVGCYLEKFTKKDGEVTAQFVRDELYVYDVY